MDLKETRKCKLSILHALAYRVWTKPKPLIPATRPGARLLALSFLALFLELTIIRWAPSVVNLIAYYANLMLISSFLGLGIGAMIANRARRFFGWFPALLLIDVVILLACRFVALPGSDHEYKFFAGDKEFLNYISLLVVFVVNALLFAPLGQEIGGLFHALPTLRAYSFDLGGSLLGTLAFGVFSFCFFSPTHGLVLVAIGYLALVRWPRWLFAIPCFALAIWPVHVLAHEREMWSPYYHLAWKPHPLLPAPDASGGDAGPVIHSVMVNQHFYQLHGTLELERYAPASPHAEVVASLRDQYLLPYQLAPGRDRILVLGSGGGMDVQGALLAGAKHVDAVDIDPVVFRLSSRLNPAQVYADPRVTPIVSDARPFLRAATPGYDLVVFGFLDSAGLFSSMSNVRLDGFTYTVESMRSAWRLVKDDGMLALSFASGRGWLAVKIMNMLETATGRPPVTYRSGSQIIACVPKFELSAPPQEFGRFQRMEQVVDGETRANGGAGDEKAEAVPLPTDDWPFLYLSRRVVPENYQIVILTLSVLSILAVLGLRGRGFGRDDAHFLFMGIGFLLLQTKSISDCALYFGSTWFVTMLVVAGVLIMVLLANLVAIRMTRSSPWHYAPLIASLIVLLVVPRDAILALPTFARLAWTLFAVPLPVFFAGLVFSTTFREAAVPSTLFGANLVGAMIGGFCEYLGMATGTSALSYLVIAAYVASFLCRLGRSGTRLAAT
jgi:hypothetical protein